MFSGLAQVEEQDLDGEHLKRCGLRPTMHCGSELEYTARKKVRKSLFPVYSTSHILLFTGAFYNLHHCMLGLAENKTGVWERRFQLVCHIQAGFCEMNFSKFLGLAVPLISLGNSFPVPVSPCRSRGLRTFLSLLLVKTVVLQADGHIFAVKNNLLPMEFLYFWKSLPINRSLKKGIFESSSRQKHSRLFSR